MSREQAEQLAREYIPWDRDFGRRAFARRFRTSVRSIDYWLDVKRYRLQSQPMELTPAEKHAAAMACRAYAFQARKDAAAQNNPSVKAGFERTAVEYERLAQRFAAE